MKRDDPLYLSTQPNAPASAYHARRAELVLVYPPEVAGRRLALSPELVLGRAPELGEGSLLHTTISRSHAEVGLGLGGMLSIRDLGSRNGTRLNGARSELPQPLVPQGVVRLGDVFGVVDSPGGGAFDESPVLPGSSPRIAELRTLLTRAAPDPAPVLVLGETGTGKERIANEIHAKSGRSGRLVALNCAELSAQLIESELFGHERGAFTGALQAKTGLFAAADEGTLFLDEIGELPLELQSKLLRVLQEGEVRPLGGTRVQKVSVRIVAATQRDLAVRAEQDLFRRDLYARLAYWEFRLPPLRERRQDILPWVSLLTATWDAERGTRTCLEFLPDAVERLLLHAWPDNLRGLGRLVHRLASAPSDRPIGVRRLGEALPELGPSDPAAPGASATSAPPGASATSSHAPPPRGTEARREAPTREEFLAAYEASGRSVRATSKHFGKDRRQIYRWLTSFGVEREPNDD